MTDKATLHTTTITQNYHKLGNRLGGKVTRELESLSVEILLLLQQSLTSTEQWVIISTDISSLVRLRLRK